MAKKAYSQQEREAIRQRLLTAGRELFAKQGYRHTNLQDVYEQVGISKNFFYTYFSTKEEFVAQVLREQQLLLLQLASQIMAEPGIAWQQAVRRFLLMCAHGSQHGIYIMQLRDQEAVFRLLKQENFAAFHQAQEIFYTRLMEIWGLQMEPKQVKMFANIALSAMLVYNSMAESILPLFAEEREATIEAQVDGLIYIIEKYNNC